MAIKRKLELDAEDVFPTVTKQLKLVPFPNVDGLDSDIAMSEAEPMYLDVHHSRLPSDASSTSTASYTPSTGSPSYPTFDLYPGSFFPANGYYNADSPSSAVCAGSPTVGLIQPSGGFMHHGSNCTQIPKLRIACASGPNGQRTMWSHCEQCGAISMVEND